MIGLIIESNNRLSSAMLTIFLNLKKNSKAKINHEHSWSIQI